MMRAEATTRIADGSRVVGEAVRPSIGVRCISTAVPEKFAIMIDSFVAFDRYMQHEL
jgi:hypothetical protein